LFYTYLYNDFNRAEKIIKENENTFHLTGKRATIDYTFNDDGIVRSNGLAADTFKVKINSINSETQGSDIRNYVKKLNLTIELNKEDLALSFEKDYLEIEDIDWKDE